MSDEQFKGLIFSLSIEQLQERCFMYNDQLLEIGGLTRWVGWGGFRAGALTEDMNKIKEIVEAATGKEFLIYT